MAEVAAATGIPPTELAKDFTMLATIAEILRGRRD